jgi:hypothetical protein
LEAVGLIAGGFGIVTAVKVNVAVLGAKVDMHATATAAAIAELKAEMKPMNTMATQQAVLDQRLLQLEQRVNELAHGEGMVLPFKSPYEHGGNRS